MSALVDIDLLILNLPVDRTASSMALELGEDQADAADDVVGR